MPNHLPESDILDVRDYIFVDESRARSLLSQLSDGLPERESRSSARSIRVQRGIKWLSGESGTVDATESSILLADLHVSLLEETAEALGLLVDVSDKARNPKFWKRGTIRKRLEPGSILRVNAPTRIASPQSLATFMRGLQSVEGETDDDFDEILRVIDALYGDAVAFSVQPTEPRESGCSFVGQISKAVPFPGFEPQHLLSRFGPEPTPMTVLFQVARVPTERESEETIDQQMTLAMSRIESAMEGDALDRGVLDDFLAQIAAMLEQTGLASAPRWPSISVTPLAMYRNVASAPTFEDLEVD